MALDSGIHAGMTILLRSSIYTSPSSSRCSRLLQTLVSNDESEATGGCFRQSGRCAGNACFRSRSNRLIPAYNYNWLPGV
jgi:hypothetical protein